MEAIYMEIDRERESVGMRLCVKGER